MSKERELLMRALPELDHKYNRDLIDEIETYLAEPFQEPEPVAWMWQSDNYANRFSQRIFVLFVEADDMRNRYGGNLYPLYFEASPNAKRIAELEGRIDELALIRARLETRINSGVRVTARRHPAGWTGWMENAPTFDDEDRTNATLLLDEQGD
jgi:hypothetical protein